MPSMQGSSHDANENPPLPESPRRPSRLKRMTIDPDDYKTLTLWILQHCQDWLDVKIRGGAGDEKAHEY